MPDVIPLSIDEPGVWLPLAFGLIALIGLALIWKWPRAWKIILGLWFCCYGVEQAMVRWHVTPREGWPARNFLAPGNEAADWLERANAKDPNGYRILPLNVEGVQQTEETIAFLLPQLNGIGSAGGYWPLQSPYHARLLKMNNVGQLLDAPGLLERPAILNLLNVRYLLAGDIFLWKTPGPYHPPPALLKIITKLNSDMYPWLKNEKVTRRETMILENEIALPRTWTVARLNECRDSFEAIDRIWKTERFEPAREAYVVWSGERSASDKLTTGTVRVTKYQPDKLWLDVEAPAGPTFVVISEAWYPGWWCRVDGALAPIHQVDGMLRGIEVPRGTHKIYLRYLPLGFKRGLKLSLVFSVLLLGWFIWERQSPDWHRASNNGNMGQSGDWRSQN